MHNGHPMTSTVPTCACAHIIDRLLDEVQWLRESVEALDAVVFPPTHAQVWTAHPEHGDIEVDAEIEPLLRALWARGLDTAYSCQDSNGYSYVMFTTRDAAERFVTLARPAHIIETGPDLDLDGQVWAIHERETNGAVIDGHTTATSVFLPAGQLAEVTERVAA
jgi:hypothetical protein